MTAALILAVGRVAEATMLQGIYPSQVAWQSD